MITAVWHRVQSARVALLAAGLSYYLLASLLPLLVLASGILGRLSQNDASVAPRLVDWLGVEGEAATLVQDSIEHAEQVHIASSVIGIAGLVWAALALTGALRRSVDAVWGVPDIGWTARFRSIPWTVVAGVLIAASVGATGLAASVNVVGGVLAVVFGVACTYAVSTWFLGRLGTCRPTRHPLLVSAGVLTVGLEVVKNGTVFVIPRIVSRDSALYGGIGSGLAALVAVLVLSWLLLLTTAIAAEMTLAADHPHRAHGSANAAPAPQFASAESAE